MHVMSKTKLYRIFTLVLGLFVVNQLVGQEKKPLTLDDYKQWNRIRNVVLSSNGEWMTYSYSPNEGDATLHVRKIDGDTLRTVINGKQIAFSSDNKWVAYLTDPTKKEADKIRKQKKRVLSDLQLLELRYNRIEEIKEVASFSFSKASNYLAIHKSRNDSKAEHQGSDLILKELSGYKTMNIGNVVSYAFNKPGTMLAYTVDADGDNGNGVYVIQLEDLRSRPLHTGAYTYSQMVWDKEGSELAYLFGNTEDGKIERDNSLVWTSGLSGEEDGFNQVIYSPKNVASFPEKVVISEHTRLTWHENGDQIFFGTRNQQDELKKEDELKANVDVWHWKDEQVQSRQMITANRDRRATKLFVLNLDPMEFYQLATDDMPNVSFSIKGSWALGRMNSEYRKDVTIPGNYADLYSINATNGQKQKIAEKVRYTMGLSPNGEWALYSKDGTVMGYNFSQNNTVDLSAKAGISFRNEEFDLVAEKPSYGVAGWSKDGNWVMLNHKHDIWAIALNSDEVKNLTQGIGSEENIRFRMVRLDREEPAIDTEQPMILSAYGEWTKKSGYYEVKMGKKPKALRFEDKMVGGIVKAKDSDKIIYTEQTFVDFPDYWTSDLAFKRPKKVTSANPQQANYKWGRRVLVDYTDRRGNKLQATLALPADYEEGKKYPMIVYFYEKMSQRHHQYSMPTYDDRPHMSTYASNGYLVLMPDIIYDDGKPGSSALDDITSAVQATIDQGYADPERIGLQGHSWGGYQSSFILTQTDMFACVVTGAPLTNLISMYNVIYKRTGNFNGPILEWSQGRMGVPPWDDMELYRSQSPIHHAKNINTPFLILHGTADGAVDWNQGLEYYQTARRLGKEVILLSYPGEPHHLAKEENQKDFQIRMKQYFDHHLKGESAPLWMTEGVKQLNKKRTQPEMTEKN